ncbi:peptidase T [Striga asiatica]|uniref:Peptidase T n=1 Tax=Striga asiatica TaxID=4170 RepID=A0A5A7PZX1_STRAF|nr:peptidase T [Striga asiatica]
MAAVRRRRGDELATGLNGARSTRAQNCRTRVGARDQSQPDGKLRPEVARGLARRMLVELAENSTSLRERAEAAARVVRLSVSGTSAVCCCSGVLAAALTDGGHRTDLENEGNRLNIEERLRKKMRVKGMTAFEREKDRSQEDIPSPAKSIVATSFVSANKVPTPGEEMVENNLQLVESSVMEVASSRVRPACRVSGLSEKGLPPQVLPNPPVRLGYICCDGLAKCHADGTYEWFSDSKVGGGIAVADIGRADSRWTCGLGDGKVGESGATGNSTAVNLNTAGGDVGWEDAC